MIKGAKLIGRVSALVLLGIVVSGCTVTAPRSHNVAGKIDQALRNSLYANNKVAARDKVLPEHLTNALMPQMGLMGSAKIADKTELEPHFDVAVQGVEAKTFFLGLVKDTPYNITVNPKVAGAITLDLKNVTVEQTLGAVEDLYGYEYEKTDYGYKISPRELQTKIFTVNYLNMSRKGKSNTTISSGQITQTISGGGSGSSSGSRGRRSSTQSSVTPSSSIETDSKTDFWAVLKETLGMLVGNAAGHSVVVNPQAGLVIVHAYPDEIKKIGQYLDSIQNIAERQVIIEAKILEVELSAQYKTGIDWKVLGLQQNGNQDFGNGFKFDFTSFLKLDAHDGNSFSTVMNLLNSQGRVSVLSSPRIAALNNEKAVIKVGEDEFFVTNISSDTSVSSGASTETQDVDLTPFFSGIALDVTPQIDDKGDVILHIHPIVSNVVEQVKEFQIGSGNNNLSGQTSLPLAKSTIRESDNVVRAKDGQVIVIGGLMEDRSANHGISTPGTEHLPAVNGLLKNVDRSSGKFELVILLKPTIVGKRTWRDEMRKMARGFRQMPKDFRYNVKRKKR